MLWRILGDWDKWPRRGEAGNADMWSDVVQEEVNEGEPQVVERLYELEEPEEKQQEQGP